MFALFIAGDGTLITFVYTAVFTDHIRLLGSSSSCCSLSTVQPHPRRADEAWEQLNERGIVGHVYERGQSSTPKEVAEE